MKIKFYALILFVALLTSLVSGCGEYIEESRGDHHQTGYVPWGVDEFELFGLTKEELLQKFEGRMHFHNEESEFAWNDRLARFRVSFDKEGKVVTVQRVFIDGAGCELKGPLLTTKKEALEFSVEGLSSLGHLDAQDQAQLAMAQALLQDIAK